MALFLIKPPLGEVWRGSCPSVSPEGESIPPAGTSSANSLVVSVYPPVSSAPTLRVGAVFLHLLQRLQLLKNDEERSDSRALEPRRSLIIGMEVADYLLYFKYCSLSESVVTLHSQKTTGGNGG